MGITLLLLTLLIIAVFISIKIKKEISQTLLLSLISILFFLYLFGITNILKYSKISLIIISIVLLTDIVFELKKHPEYIKLYLLKPAFLFLLIVFVFSLIFFRNSYLKNWDEFTHWALYAKNVYLYDKLAGAEFTSTNNGYPPIVTLLQYIVAQFENRFTEANLYRCTFIFSCLMLTPVLVHTSFKKPIHMLIMFLLIMFLPLTIFTNYLSSIYVDALVSIIFASALIKLYFQDISLFNWIYMFLISSILILAKESTLILVAIFYVLVFCDFVFIRRKQYLKYYKEHIQYSFIKKVGLALATVFPIISKLSWSLYLGNQTTPISSAIKTSTYEFPSYGNEVIKTFFEYLFTTETKIGKNSTTPILLLLLSLLMAHQ